MFDRPIAYFFAGRIRITPAEAKGAADVFNSITDNLMTYLEEEMAKNDIADIEDAGQVDTLSSQNGEDITLTARDGTISTPRIEREVTLPNDRVQQITVPSQDITVRGVGGYWTVDGGEILVAGGMYPIDDYTVDRRMTVTGEKFTGFDVIADVSVPLSDAESRVKDNIKAVQA